MVCHLSEIVRLQSVICMRIATWNVNSVRQRIELLVSWLKECSPTSSVCRRSNASTTRFLAWRSRRSGTMSSPTAKKTFDGVALLSKLPFDETKSGLAGDDEDAHARFLEGVVTLKQGVIRVACLYLPNGNPANTDKYPYKLKWMSRLLGYAKERLKAEEPLILAGDFNVIPAARDVYNPAAWADDALFRPATREAFQSLLGLGLTDALRAVNDEPGQYTFWDYQAGAWQKNWGLRIDHLLMSPQASRPADRCRHRQLCPGPGRSRPTMSRSGPISISRPPGLAPAGREIDPGGPAPSARASAAPSRDRPRTPWRSPGCSFP
ncbi:exodeoxyribonuclease III [Bradyrhizobium sp. 13971]